MLHHVWACIKQEGTAGVIVVPETPWALWWQLLQESSLASVPLDLGDRQFSSHTPLDQIYTLGRVAWHAHVFVYGHRVSPDCCLLFRQVGGKPASPVTSHPVAVCQTFLAEHLAVLG
eukprot:727961-Rhodomonas_salina.2